MTTDNVFVLSKTLQLQVAFIDVTKESPVDHGMVICFSIYGGADLHFGPEQNPVTPQNQLWIDTYFQGQASFYHLVPQFSLSYNVFGGALQGLKQDSFTR